MRDILLPRRMCSPAIESITDVQYIVAHMQIFIDGVSELSVALHRAVDHDFLLQP